MKTGLEKGVVSLNHIEVKKTGRKETGPWACEPMFSPPCSGLLSCPSQPLTGPIMWPINSAAHSSGGRRWACASLNRRMSPSGASCSLAWQKDNLVRRRSGKMPDFYNGGLQPPHNSSGAAYTNPSHKLTPWLRTGAGRGGNGEVVGQAG